MNSTLKSLLFWIVLIAVGIMIWQFSTGWQRQPAALSFTDFLEEVNAGQVHSVVMTGNEITGKRNGVPAMPVNSAPTRRRSTTGWPTCSTKRR